MLFGLIVRPFPPARGSHGQQNGGQEDSRHDQQRQRRRNIELKPERRLAVVRVQDHFHAGENQDEREAHFQVTEITNGARQHKVKRAQAENRKNIGREHNKGLRGHRENRRDGIQGKNQVGGFNHQQDQGQRREGSLALPYRSELVAVQVRRDGIKLPRQAHDAVFLRLHVGLHKEHFDSAKEQESALHIKDPVKQGNE